MRVYIFKKCGGVIGSVEPVKALVWTRWLAYYTLQQLVKLQFYWNYEYLEVDECTTY